jgi:hypothetical protein
MVVEAVSISDEFGEACRTASAFICVILGRCRRRRVLPVFFRFGLLSEHLMDG